MLFRYVAVLVERLRVLETHRLAAASADREADAAGDDLPEIHYRFTSRCLEYFDRRQLEYSSDRLSDERDKYLVDVHLARPRPRRVIEIDGAPSGPLDARVIPLADRQVRVPDRPIG